MKKIDNSKGITLIALVITIIVLLIVASIATYSGIQVVESSKFTAFVTEMKIMQAEVNNLYDQWKNGKITIDETTGNITNTADNSVIGKDLTYNSDVQRQANEVLIKVLGLGSSINDLKEYKYFDHETIQNLGIDAIDGEFFINIKTRKVVSYEGIEYEREKYYTLEQLPQGLYNVDYDPQQSEKPTFDMNYKKIGGNKWRVTISNIQYSGYIDKWYVKYQEDGADYWNTTEDMSFVVNKSWIYNVTIENGDVKSSSKAIFVNDVNEPKLAEGMIPIKWDNEKSNWVICSENDAEWYNYVDQANGIDGTSKWANVMLSDGKYYAQNSSNINKTNKQLATEGQGVEKADLGSMFVWIPRYAYSIENGYHSNQAGKINISFLEGTKKYDIGDEICYASQGTIGRKQLVNSSGQENWNEHPAFNYGGTIVPGIWVAKFEASSSNPSASYGGGDVTNLNVKVLPGVTSWRYITTGNSYTNCINMNSTSNASYYGINTDDNKIDPHLMKNSEWGAVAYLTQSSYGRNGNKVTMNNSSSYITGSAGNSESAAPDEGTTNDYTNAQGMLASTTGNTTGIYDMSGGALERVSGYINNRHSNLKTYGQALLNAPDKHKQVYTVTTDSQSENYRNMSTIYGDAVYETSSTSTESTSWYGNYSSCPYSTSPFFIRGGYSQSGSVVGVFYFNSTPGGVDSGYSFRPSIVVY